MIIKIHQIICENTKQLQALVSKLIFLYRHSPLQNRRGLHEFFEPELWALQPACGLQIKAK